MTAFAETAPVPLDAATRDGLLNVVNVLTDGASGVRAAEAGDLAKASQLFGDLAVEATALTQDVPATRAASVPAAQALASLATELAARPESAADRSADLYAATALVGAYAIVGTCEESVVGANAPAACDTLPMTQHHATACVNAPDTNCLRPALIEALLANLNTFLDNAIMQTITFGPENAYDLECGFSDPTNPEGDPSGTPCEYVQPSNVLLDAKEVAATRSTGVYGCKGWMQDAQYRPSDRRIYAYGWFECDDYWNTWSGNFNVQRKVCGWGGCNYQSFGTAFTTRNDGGWGYEFDHGMAWGYCKPGTHRYRSKALVVITPRNPQFYQYIWKYTQGAGTEYTCPFTASIVDLGWFDEFVFNTAPGVAIDLVDVTTS